MDEYVLCHVGEPEILQHAVGPQLVGVLGHVWKLPEEVQPEHTRIQMRMRMPPGTSLYQDTKATRLVIVLSMTLKGSESRGVDHEYYQVYRRFHFDTSKGSKCNYLQKNRWPMGGAILLEMWVRRTRRKKGEVSQCGRYRLGL